MKTVEEYLELPYSILLRLDEEGDWLARIGEFTGCLTHGATITEAVARLRDVQMAWIEACIEDGIAIPDPTSEDEWLQLKVR